jgi:4-methylaminobutanoate oxidase (formaldehyde-forming)
LLQGLTAFDLDQRAFGFMTSQEISVGDVPVRAGRVTFVGELGWELYASAEYAVTLWESLCRAGAPHGMLAGGYRAIDSLRLEKGYRVWGSDLTGETDPLSAGLEFCVAWDKPGGFLGRDALAKIRDNGPTRRLACLTLDDPRMVVLGGEPVRVDGAVVGRVTSGGFGYSVHKSIAYSYLPVACAAIGTEVAVDIFGDWVPGRVAPDQLHDPRGTSIRA